MTCREVIEALELLRSRGLDPSARKRFEAHLAVCSECIQYFESFETSVRLGRASRDDEPCPEAPRTLVEAILDAIERS